MGKRDVAARQRYGLKSHIRLYTVLVLALAPVTPLRTFADSRASPASLAEQVAATERAFAKTMADRDLAAFGRFISEEAVFVSGGNTLRGREQVIDGWRKRYAGPTAPFSWEPQHVEVLDSGSLALSSGPVHDPAGKLVGTYTSIWRLEAPDTWRVVFDSGCPLCASCGDMPAQASASSSSTPSSAPEPVQTSLPAPAPSAAAAAPMQSTKYGMQPVHYREAVQRYLDEHLSDGSSVELREVSSPEPGFFTDVTGTLLMRETRTYGWIVKVSVHAKGARGDHADLRHYSFLFRGEEIAATQSAVGTTFAQ